VNPVPESVEPHKRSKTKERKLNQEDFGYRRRVEEAEKALKEDPKVKVLFVAGLDKELYDRCVEVKDGDGVEVGVDGKMVWIKLKT
jgi:hypothetical protein